MLSTSFTYCCSIARCLRDRIDAGVGQRGAHHRQIVGVDEDRALLEIQLQRFFDPLADHAEVEHQVGDRPVAMARRAFGHENRVVDDRRRGPCSG